MWQSSARLPCASVPGAWEIPPKVQWISASSIAGRPLPRHCCTHLLDGDMIVEDFNVGSNIYLVYIDAKQRVEPQSVSVVPIADACRSWGVAEYSTRIADAHPFKTPTEARPHRDDLSAYKIR